MQNWLSGKKTYIMAVAVVAWAWLSVYTGHMDVNTAIGITMGGTGLGALRAGVAKLQ